MNTSEQINELAAALSKAQAAIIGARKDSANPFFKSRYADLASVWDAVRDALTTNGLSVAQIPCGSPNGSIGLTTRLMHASGQWIEDTLFLTPKDNSPQGMGSALTYGRRYALAAITGCPQIDDDGEAAMGRQQQTSPLGDAHKAVPAPAIAAAVDRIRKVLAKDIDEDAQCLELFDIHTSLSKDSDLYIAVAEVLNDTKVLTKAQLKASVKRGHELANKVAA